MTYSKEWYSKYRESILEANRRYRETPAGKEAHKKAKEKQLMKNPKYSSDFNKRWRAEQKKKGLCIKCKDGKPSGKYVQCDVCLSIQRERLLKKKGEK